MRSVKSKEKFLLYFLLGLSFFLSYPMAVMAHPPKSLTAEYDNQSQKLTIRIDHGSFSSKMHYISNVEVKKNAQVVINQTYKNQSDKNPFEYTYEIPAKVGDVLEIKATCNMYGSKTVSITVAKEDN